MARTSTAITAVGAVVREALVGAGGPSAIGLTIELTVSATDILAALTAAEAQALNDGSLGIVFGTALTNDDGSLMHSGSVPAYREAVEMGRVALKAGQVRALRNRANGRPDDASPS